jgi:hypothetical protein
VCIPDFWRNVELWLDGQNLITANLDEENRLESSSLLWNSYDMCYRIGLEIGPHRMRYVFQWEPAGILDIGEWEFTIIADNNG